MRTRRTRQPQESLEDAALTLTIGGYVACGLAGGFALLVVLVHPAGPRNALRDAIECGAIVLCPLALGLAALASARALRRYRPWALICGAALAGLVGLACIAGAVAAALAAREHATALFAVAYLAAAAFVCVRLLFELRRASGAFRLHQMDDPEQRGFEIEPAPHFNDSDRPK